MNQLNGPSRNGKKTSGRQLNLDIKLYILDNLNCWAVSCLKQKSQKFLRSCRREPQIFLHFQDFAADSRRFFLFFELLPQRAAAAALRRRKAAAENRCGAAESRRLSCGCGSVAPISPLVEAKNR